jgi:flavin-dependent dehydrogenase
MTETYDAIVVGGGPAGATAADDLAQHGRKVLLLDRAVEQGSGHADRRRLCRNGR